MQETLLELVNKMDNDVVFNVGTEGSGWIFIGTKTEFLKTIDSINKFYTKKYSLLLKNAISAIESVTVLNRKRKKIQDKYKRSLFHDMRIMMIGIRDYWKRLQSFLIELII